MKAKNLKSYITETSLNRLYQKTQDHAVGTITAFRGDQTYAVNRENNQRLLAWLLNRGYSVTKIKGSYIEQFGTDTEKEVSEESFFVVNPAQGDDHGQLEADLISLGQAFDQDSIMSYRYRDAPTLVGTSAREDSFPGQGRRQAYPNTEWGHSTGPFFSRVKGRQFSFAEATECAYPGTINGVRVMKEYAQTLDEHLGS